MAKAKTSSFYIRRNVPVSTIAAQTVSLDTSAYVDPGDRQGLMIEEVDFVFYDSSTNLPLSPASDTQIAVQLLSGAYTELQGYDEEDMVASAGIILDGAAGHYNDSDLYPDRLATPGGRIVVDDNMTLVGAGSRATTNALCAVMIKAKVVTLTNKDFMSLALQTIAN